MRWLHLGVLSVVVAIASVLAFLFHTALPENCLIIFAISADPQGIGWRSFNPRLL